MNPWETGHWVYEFDSSTKDGPNSWDYIWRNERRRHRTFVALRWLLSPEREDYRLIRIRHDITGETIKPRDLR